MMFPYKMFITLADQYVFCLIQTVFLIIFNSIRGICDGIIDDGLKIKVNILGLRYVVKVLQPYRAIAKDFYFYEHLDETDVKMVIDRDKKSGEPFHYKDDDDEKEAK